MLKAKFVSKAEQEAHQQAEQEQRQAGKDRETLLDDLIDEQAAKRAGDANAPEAVKAAAERQTRRR